jgi:hypothetical protein
MLSALVLTPSSAAPDPAHTIRVTGYEPQRSGVLGDEQPAHFTIEEIPCIPSRSYRSPEPRNLAKRVACHHLCPARTFPPLPSLWKRSPAVKVALSLGTTTFVSPSTRRSIARTSPGRLRPSPPLSARSLSRYTPRTPPAGPPGISGRSAAATSPRSPATYRQHCRVNRSPAPSPPQLDVVRQ